MPQTSLQEIPTAPAPGTASLSDIQDSQATGTASLSDIAGPKVLSLVGIASTIKEP